MPCAGGSSQESARLGCTQSLGTRQMNAISPRAAEPGPDHYPCALGPDRPMLRVQRPHAETDTGTTHIGAFGVVEDRKAGTWPRRKRSRPGPPWPVSARYGGYVASAEVETQAGLLKARAGPPGRGQEQAHGSVREQPGREPWSYQACSVAGNRQRAEGFNRSPNGTVDVPALLLGGPPAQGKTSSGRVLHALFCILSWWSPPEAWCPR